MYMQKAAAGANNRCPISGRRQIRQTNWICTARQSGARHMYDSCQLCSARRKSSSRLKEPDMNAHFLVTETPAPVMCHEYFKFFTKRQRWDEESKHPSKRLVEPNPAAYLRQFAIFLVRHVHVQYEPTTTLTSRNQRHKLGPRDADNTIAQQTSSSSSLQREKRLLMRRAIVQKLRDGQRSKMFSLSLFLSLSFRETTTCTMPPTIT